MTHSFVDDKEKLKMSVTVFLGSATFILPDGAEVRPSGMALLAASMVDVPDHDDTSDLPTLDIEWSCIFGRLRILSEDAAARLAAEEEQKRLERGPRHRIFFWRRGPVPDTTAAPPVVAASAAVPTPAPAAVAPAAEPAPSAAPTPDPAPPADDPEPAVSGIGFEDLSDDEPVVTGVGFEDLSSGDDAADDEPVVTG
ncbi:MAG: hypothetical protein AAF547_19670, partial [Actinomycetota bacterium]